MTERDAMLASILLAPDDPGPRLILADFLEEREQGDVLGLLADCLRREGQWRLVSHLNQPQELWWWRGRWREPLPGDVAVNNCFRVAVLPEVIHCRQVRQFILSFDGPNSTRLGVCGDTTDGWKGRPSVLRRNGRWVCLTCFDWLEKADPASVKAMEERYRRGERSPADVATPSPAV